MFIKRLKSTVFLAALLAFGCNSGRQTDAPVGGEGIIRPEDDVSALLGAVELPEDANAVLSIEVIAPGGEDGAVARDVPASTAETDVASAAEANVASTGVIIDSAFMVFKDIKLKMQGEPDGACAQGTSSNDHDEDDCHDDYDLACTNNGDCDDGLYCNGAETCGSDGECDEGEAPCDADTNCLEGINSCGLCTSSLECDDGVFCNGAETCGSDEFCVAGTAPCAANSNCFEDTDSCGLCTSHKQCDDGVFCNGAEICDIEGLCRQGPDPCCGHETCLEDTGSCGLDDDDNDSKRDDSDEEEDDDDDAKHAACDEEDEKVHLKGPFLVDLMDATATDLRQGVDISDVGTNAAFANTNADELLADDSGVFDEATAAAAPPYVLDALSLPPGVYRKVKVKIGRLKGKHWGLDDHPMNDRSILVTGNIGGVPFEYSSRKEEKLKYESDNGLLVEDGSVATLLITIDMAEWFAGVDLTGAVLGLSAAGDPVVYINEDTNEELYRQIRKQIRSQMRFGHDDHHTEKNHDEDDD